MQLRFGTTQGNGWFGGVAVRARVYDTWVCFVCAQLASRRNAENRAINSYLEFYPRVPRKINDYKYEFKQSSTAYL